jgi:protein-S-isoprenylcysteine O-methyltransferase Ste14
MPGWSIAVLVIGSLFLLLFVLGLIFPLPVLKGLKKFNIGTIAGGNGALLIIIFFLIAMVFVFWIWLGAKIGSKIHKKRQLSVIVDSSLEETTKDNTEKL